MAQKSGASSIQTSSIKSPLPTSPSQTSIANSSLVTREPSTHSHVNFETDVAETKPSSHTLLNWDGKGKDNKPEEGSPTDAEKGKEEKQKKDKCGRTPWVVLAVVGWLLFAATLIVVLVAGEDLFAEDTDEAVASSSDVKFCHTERCTLSASQMISRMNKNVDPCEDFYQYACGGFLSQIEVPKDKPMVRSVGNLMDLNKERILSILEDSNSEKESESLKNARNFYKACMDTNKIEERGDTFFKTWMKSKFDALFEKWPMSKTLFQQLVKAKIFNKEFILTDTLVKLGRLGIHPLVEISITPDFENSKNYSIWMGQPSLLHGSKENFENDQKSDVYRDLLNKFVMTLKGSNASPNEDVPKEIKDHTNNIIIYETLLSKILVPRENINPAMFKRMTLKDIAEEYKGTYFHNIHYKRLFEKWFENITDISEDEIIINTVPSYFKDLTDLVDDYDVNYALNYVLTDMLLTFSEYLPQKYNDIYHEYVQKIQGVQNFPRRDFQCAKGASDAMELAVGAEYAKRYFGKDSKQEILDMIKEIQKSFNDLIDETPWMDDKTKSAAKDKNDAITNIMGYDDIILNETYVRNRYIDYVFAPDKYLENVWLQREKDTFRNLKVLRKPVDYKDELESALVPQVVNAFNAPLNNKIVFPAGILQPQLFHKENPRYMNYGGIGTIIGHEITHGFDSNGRKYDKEGNIKPWWTIDSVTAFVKETKCFVSQYGNLNIPGTKKKVNGNFTLGENIADNGGFSAALEGYRNMVAKKGADPKLPGLATMSNEQLFFVNQAQNWCVKYTKEFAENFLEIDEHSPGEVRVKGILMNSPDFAQVFNCPKNSPMNPDKKCRIWGPKIEGT